jgi:hypothetical protein
MPPIIKCQSHFIMMMMMDWWCTSNCPSFVTFHNSSLPAISMHPITSIDGPLVDDGAMIMDALLDDDIVKLPIIINHHFAAHHDDDDHVHTSNHNAAWSKHQHTWVALQLQWSNHFCCWWQWKCWFNQHHWSIDQCWHFNWHCKSTSAHHWSSCTMNEWWWMGPWDEVTLIVWGAIQIVSLHVNPDGQLDDGDGDDGDGGDGDWAGMIVIWGCWLLDDGVTVGNVEQSIDLFHWPEKSLK